VWQSISVYFELDELLDSVGFEPVVSNLFTERATEMEYFMTRATL